VQTQKLEPPSERWRPTIPLFLIGAASAIHLLAIRTYAIDSDEPQHLHVVWGWIHGLVQYKQVFDNHSPLFHLISIPWIRMLGERPDILYLARLEMMPFYLVAIALTFAISRRIDPAPVAWWAAAAFAFLPPFFYRTLEFRNDNLWLVCWLGVVLVLLGRTLTAGRLFLAGLLLGTAFASSMKSTVLLLSLLVSGGILAAALPGLRPLWRRWRLWLAALSGLLVLPIALAAFFAAKGALGDLYYCVIRFNTLYSVSTRRHIIGYALVVLGCAVLASLTVRYVRQAGEGDPRPLFLLLNLVATSLLVGGLWPIVRTRDFLPVFPLLAILLVGFIARTRTASWRASALPAALAALVMAEGVFCVVYQRLWIDETRKETALLSRVLSVTRFGEEVVDVKGETVFRSRPTYYAMELISRSLMARGILADRGPADILARRCLIAVDDSPNFPPHLRAFLDRNFIDVGGLRVAGQLLMGSESSTFRLAVPAQYALVGETHQVTGLLDGLPYQGPRFLSAGAHFFRASGPPERIALIWSEAVARGLSPFRLQ
jgi:hypothetical protein